MKTSKEKLIHLLTDSCLFGDQEISDIVNLVGVYSLGNAIIACELLGIELTGNDIDTLIACQVENA